ncbi:Gfo/Idh/MocA family protein [Ammoniphilus sp. YIM 78166]|uniref:Gfo/Idh/MocA family protein n=1 Tax=Ammoniphilus sp. YIM 78166 TaxID=1644106 RepID=UPI00106F417D|nr:Gfo/Idh/MocA family oxidoreductase [Ammoniphilus sp. YIM 78166]
MQKIKYGIMSTARIADKQVVPAIHSAANAEVIAVASRDEKKARMFAERHQIPKVYDSYEKLLEDPDIDAVYIPLPNHLHAEWTIRAAEKGKHILCEKPIALNAKQAMEMVESCKQHGVKFMEAFMYQFHPQWKRVRELIDKGEIGKVKKINAAFSFLLNQPNDIRLEPLKGGGALYDVGTYCVHVSSLLLGGEPSQVQSIAKFSNQVDLTLNAQLVFPNDVMVQFDCSFEYAQRQFVEIVGEIGVIKVTLPFRPDKGVPAIDISGHLGHRVETFEEYDAYTLQIEHFSSCILYDQKPFYSPEKSIANMKIIDQIYSMAGKRNSE